MAKLNRTRSQKSFTRHERDERVKLFINHAINSMHVCRHAGTPETGLLIARSAFPILVSEIHAVLCERRYGQSVSRQLDDLRAAGHISESILNELRSGAAALGEYGSPRDLACVVNCCDTLRTITKSETFRDAKSRRIARAKKANDRRPRLIRWASAAAGLFAVGH